MPPKSAGYLPRMWHEGPCIPHPDHEVDVPCAVCYACDYHVRAEVESITEAMPDLMERYLYGGEMPVGAWDAFGDVVDAIRKGAHRVG